MLRKNRNGFHSRGTTQKWKKRLLHNKLDLILILSLSQRFTKELLATTMIRSNFFKKKEEMFGLLIKANKYFLK